jgi:hypothetical protein
MIQLEQDKKRAEEDKEWAMQALEARSREFFQEREQKKKLEEKIRLMNSQLLIGGEKIEDLPQFRSALEKEQKKIRIQYEDKLKELERERMQIEQEKVQVDKYKHLLLKQRDIMIALTNRLNERDENILQLQEELDVYDKIHSEGEEIMQKMNNRIEELEKFIVEKGIKVPNELKSKEFKRKMSFSGGKENKKEERFYTENLVFNFGNNFLICQIL